MLTKMMHLSKKVMAIHLKSQPLRKLESSPLSSVSGAPSSIGGKKSSVAASAFSSLLSTGVRSYFGKDERLGVKMYDHGVMGRVGGPFFTKAEAVAHRLAEEGAQGVFFARQEAAGPMFNDAKADKTRL